MDERNVTEFDLSEQNQRGNSPRFANINDNESEQEKFSIYSKHSSKMQEEGKNSYMPLATDKYYSSGFPDRNPVHKYRRP